jgi:predicted TIM-barrel fold metal-dependent hydrolase
MTPRRFVVPPLACDAHLHVFGPPARYPGAASRQYDPVTKPLAEYLRVAEALGLSRFVLVQPSAYGSDNRAQLDALRECGGRGRAVAVIDAATPDGTLDAMHEAGVRGVRANLMNPRVSDERAARAVLAPLAARIRPRGWHLQIYADAALLAQVAPVLAALGVPVVLDHMAGVRRDDALDAPGVERLLRLLADGACWVKVAGADIVARFRDDIQAAAPFMRAMIRERPDQVVWGTDWPHLAHFHGAMGDAAPPAQFRRVDDAALLDLLADCVPDEATWRRILVDNPARLYDFGSDATAG